MQQVVRYDTSWHLDVSWPKVTSSDVYCWIKNSTIVCWHDKRRHPDTVCRMRGNSRKHDLTNASSNFVDVVAELNQLVWDDALRRVLYKLKMVTFQGYILMTQKTFFKIQYLLLRWWTRTNGNSMTTVEEKSSTSYTWYIREEGNLQQQFVWQSPSSYRVKSIYYTS